MQLFYTPGIHPSQKEFFLSEEESRHCIKVLRLAAGTSIQLVDGRGGLYEAVIRNNDPKKTLLQILSVVEPFNKRNHYLHVALAPTKNLDRLEWFLEKATEIGIDEISFIICKHSERKELKTDRLNKVVTAAMKQSLKAYHPVLNPPLSFNEFMSKPLPGIGYIAHCTSIEKLPVIKTFQINDNYTMLIGPEGDFTIDEVELALNNGYKSVTLGESRLRTETAALEACFEINFLNR